MGDERFLTFLTRNALGAGLLAVVFLFAIPRHAGVVSDYVDVFTLAFCFTFLGHYVDPLLRGFPGIDVGLGRLVRVLGWFAGGLWCYVVARWLWIHYGRDLSDLPGLLWGGVFFVGHELVIRMKARPQKKPSAVRRPSRYG
jgi:hypothetical protein